MGQSKFAVPLKGRKYERYLMKAYVKDFPNLLDSNRETVAFTIFCLVLYVGNYGFNMETRLTVKQLFSIHSLSPKTNKISIFNNKQHFMIFLSSKAKIHHLI